MCGGGNGGRTPTLFFSNSFGPRNCYGLVLRFLTTCNGGGYGCPLGCKGKKGCGNVSVRRNEDWMAKVNLLQTFAYLQTQTCKL
jgi:hypothetical protein